MRTTLTLEDDLAGILKRQADEQGVSFKAIVNQTIRTGLGTNSFSKAKEPPKTIPHSFGFKPGIDLEKLNQLVDELEAESVIEKLSRKQK